MVSMSNIMRKLTPLPAGLNIRVEMTPDETLKFIERRQHFLEMHSEQCTKRIAEIQAHLKLLIDGLARMPIDPISDTGNR
mmetsp:Transcript_2634/g.7916  ORF Transcript_2634/g.7916 Transcript_2634/m.7916 type:complete len:80 (-) Transcript_2634:134-373(-)